MASTCDQQASPSRSATPSSPATPLGAEVRFDAALRSHLHSNLGHLDRSAIPLDGRRHAAVAVVVVDSDAEAHGRNRSQPRPKRLRPIPGRTAPASTGSVAGYRAARPSCSPAGPWASGPTAGQWAFPGGRVEPARVPSMRARRELREELGLDLDAVGLSRGPRRLPDPLRLCHHARRLLGWRGPATQPDPGEVRSVHRVSFRELCRPDSPRFVSIPESDRPVVQMPSGATSSMPRPAPSCCSSGGSAIEGVLERVAEYEQPVFAWR